MNWSDTVDKNAFVQHVAAVAMKTIGPPLEATIRAARKTDSPIEATFAAWFSLARTRLLADGFSRFAVTLRPQAVVMVENHHYRLDFVVEPMDEWLSDALRAAEIPLRLGVELDGHDFHERTPAQVTARNRRDRHLQQAHWRLLHFSGSELHRNPMIAVVEVLTVGADALDHAKAALLHG